MTSVLPLPGSPTIGSWSPSHNMPLVSAPDLPFPPLPSSAYQLMSATDDDGGDDGSDDY